jgi:hypothetical protein
MKRSSVQLLKLCKPEAKSLGVSFGLASQLVFEIDESSLIRRT